MEKEQEKKISVHEFWMAYRRQYNNVKEPNRLKITNEEVEDLIYQFLYHRKKK